MRIRKTQKNSLPILSAEQLHKKGSFRAFFALHRASSRRVKYSFLASIIILSSVVSAALPLVAPKTAYAAPPAVYADQTLISDITAFAYRNALVNCVANSRISGNLNISTNVEDIANGLWFGKDEIKGTDVVNQIVPVSPIVSPPDGLMGCTRLPTKAVQAFGWTTNTEAACDIGIVVRQNNSTCATGTGDFRDANTSRDSMTRVINDKRFDGNARFTNPMYYLYYVRSMEIRCGAQPSQLYDEANLDEKARAGTNANTWVINAVAYVDGNAVVNKTIYTASASRDDMASMLPTPRDSSTQISCLDLATKSYAYAGDYAEYLSTNPPVAGDTSGCDTDPSGAACGAPIGSSTCPIAGIGWIVCPVITFMSTIVDQAYKLVASLLKTPALSTDTNSPTYRAWSVMRNFANVAFVIAFLLIIYSQITGVGITNYGIKKMLPRIIIAAILVNISYWICAVAVDLSNILGGSLKGLLDGTKDAIGDSSAPGQSWATLSSQLLVVGGGAVAAVAIGLYVGLSALLPMLILALAAIVTVVLVLTLRQALLIILIVISPLAFVAYLLPNTESLFQKWRKLLQTLLLMFPIIAVIFGGSSLAARVILDAAGKENNYILQVMAAGVTIIPLFITPIIMKTAGGLLNRFGGMVNNPNKGPFDRMRKGAEGYRSNRKEYRKLKSANGYRSLPGMRGNTERKMKRDAVLNNRKSELNRANSSYVSDLAQNDEKFRGKLAQGGSAGASDRALASAINTQRELQVKEVTAANAIIENANLDLTQMQTLAKGGSVTYTDKSGMSRELTAAAGSSLQTAAIKNQFKVGDVAKTDELIAASASMGIEQRQAMAEGAQALSSKVKYYGGDTGDKIRQGAIGSTDALNTIVADTINKGKYSQQDLANQDKDSLERIADVAGSHPAVGSSAKASLMDMSAKLELNSEIYPSVDDRKRKYIENIKLGVRHNP